MVRFAVIVASVFVAHLLAADTGAAETLEGPVEARLVEVVDGDTVTVEARVWIGQIVRTRVRLAGIDAPEPRSSCAAERERAQAARDFLAARLAKGPLYLSQVRYGKFAGRVVARLADKAGADVGAALMARGLARPYEGAARRPWCDEAGRISAAAP